MTLRPSRRPSRIACCAVGGARPPVVRSGTAAMSPAAHASGTPTTRRWSSTTIRPRSSTGSVAHPGERRRLHPRCPDQRVGRERLPVRQPDRSPPRRTRAACAAARRCCVPPAVPARRPRDPPEARAGSDRPPRPAPIASRSDAAAGSCFIASRARSSSSPNASTPAYPAPTNTNVSAARRTVRILGLRRDVQPREHVVPQVDRLLHRLEPDPVLRQPGDGEHARPRTRGHDEHVVRRAARFRRPGSARRRSALRGRST